MQVLSFLDDIFPALLSSLSDTSDEVGPTTSATRFSAARSWKADRIFLVCAE